MKQQLVPRGPAQPAFQPKDKPVFGGQDVWVPKYRITSSTFRINIVRDGEVIRTHEGLNDEQLDAEVKQAIADGDLYTWWAS